MRRNRERRGEREKAGEWQGGIIKKKKEKEGGGTGGGSQQMRRESFPGSPGS